MREPHEVVRHELRGGDGALAGGAHDRDLLLREDREAVDHALRANLLDDADEQVRPHDAHEEHVAVLPGDEHEQGEREVHAVEEREGVLGEYLANRLGADVGVCVGPAVGHALGHLRVGEAGERRVLLVGHVISFRGGSYVEHCATRRRVLFVSYERDRLARRARRADGPSARHPPGERRRLWSNLAAKPSATCTPVTNVLLADAFRKHSVHNLHAPGAARPYGEKNVRGPGRTRRPGPPASNGAPRGIRTHDLLLRRQTL